MNSGMLDHGERFSQTFDETGTFRYACDPHGWMTGTITVVE
jgi:plastocyanin